MFSFVLWTMIFPTNPTCFATGGCYAANRFMEQGDNVAMCILHHWTRHVRNEFPLLHGQEDFVRIHI